MRSIIGSIDSSYAVIAVQSSVKRTGVAAFEKVMAGVENTPTLGAMSLPQSTLQSFPQPSSTTEGKSVDFTNITRAELRNVINSKIKSGELSIDGTEGFVVMMGPSEAEQAGQTGNTQIDFVQSVRDQMQFTKEHGNAVWLSRLETAFGTMQRYQGQLNGESLVA